MSKTKNKIDLTSLSSVDIYKLVLSNKLKRFPKGFWKEEKSKQYAIECVKYLIEEHLCLSDNEIKTQFNFKLFKEHKLAGMCSELFNNSIYLILDTTYPGRFKAWELTSVPQGFWKDKSNCRDATKWLISKINLSEEDIKTNLTYQVFCENGLDGMLVHGYNNSYLNAINDIYPNKFKPWELNNVPKGFWQDKNNRVEALRWIISELNWSEDYFINNLNLNTFAQFNLSSLYINIYKKSRHAISLDLCPHLFKI